MKPKILAWAAKSSLWDHLKFNFTLLAEGGVRPVAPLGS